MRLLRFVCVSLILGFMENILRKWREENRLTQTELAERIGIDQPSLSRWERGGKIPAERVRKVSEVTGIPREELRPDLFA